MKEMEMTKVDQNLADALIKAIRAERDGNSFYMMAAQSSSDAKGKHIFETLAKEELDHMNFLTLQYHSLLRTGTVDLTVKLGPRLDLSESWPIFSESIKSRIKGSHYEMSALAIGAQLEHDAMLFYKQQAEKAASPDAQKFFAELAEWETGHYNALITQQQLLKEDYWGESGFAPF
jgi:rubrerythrin